MASVSDTGFGVSAAGAATGVGGGSAALCRTPTYAPAAAAVTQPAASSPAANVFEIMV
jgi:hypothetical protein